MGNFQQFWSTTKRNVMLLSLHTSVDEFLPSYRRVSSSVLSSAICKRLSGWRHYPTPSGIDFLKKTLSSSLWLPGEDYYPAPFAIGSLGGDIIQLHLELTLWMKALSSSLLLPGEDYYPAPFAIDYRVKTLSSSFMTPWGRLLSSSVCNWLSGVRHYPVPSDFLGRIIIQLRLQLTVGGRHYPAPFDSLGKNISQLHVQLTLGEDIIQLHLHLTVWGKTLSSSSWLSRKDYYLVPSTIYSRGEDIIQLLLTPWGRFYPASSAIYPLGEDIVQLRLQLTIWRKTLSSFFWLPREDYYPAPSAIDSLGEDIIQLHLELTLLRKTLSSSLWLPGEDYYPAPSAFYYRGNALSSSVWLSGEDNYSALSTVQLYLWEKAISSFIWNWLS